MQNSASRFMSYHSTSSISQKQKYHRYHYFGKIIEPLPLNTDYLTNNKIFGFFSSQNKIGMCGVAGDLWAVYFSSRV